MATKRLIGSAELDHRVREHGGIIETIEWGVTSESIEDPELATVWRGIEEHYADLRNQLIIASRMLVASRRAARNRHARFRVSLAVTAFDRG